MVVVYLSAIVLANLTVVWFGPAWSIVNAFLFIGLDLTARDRLHRRWRRDRLVWRMAGLIAAGGILSFAVNRDSGRVALASFVAFTVAAILDAVVFHYTGSVTRSNVVAAAADSIIFPTVAFGGLLPLIVAGQFAAKVAGGEVWRRVLVDRQKPIPAPRPSPGSVPGDAR